MKKTSLCLAIIMAFCSTSLFAQRSDYFKQIEEQAIQHRLGQRSNDGIVLESYDYQRLDDDGSVIVYHTDCIYDEYDYTMTEELTRVKTEEGWTDAFYDTYEYDFSGNVIEHVLQEWNGGAWRNNFYETYTYDDDLLSEYVSQYWYGGTWQNYIKVVYDYNDEGMTALYYDWNNGWKVNDLYTYTYTMEGMELLMQYMQGGAWQNEERMTYAIDGEQIQSILSEKWMNNAWHNDEFAIYTYDEGAVVSILYQEWENAWASKARVDYQNEDGNAIHGLRFEWNGNAWVDGYGDINMYYRYGEEVEEFGYVHEVMMKYVDIDAVEEQHANVFSVYPNPTSERISVSGEGFLKAEVYNVAGQKVMETSVNSINVNNLQAGVYMLKVYDVNGAAETQSFVVK